MIPRSTPTLPMSYTSRCDGGPQCRTRPVIFPGLVATDFTVRVTTNLGVRETTPPPARFQLRDASVKDEGLQPGVNPAHWSRVVAEIYTGRGA
ncbi:MAG: hypothetical protein ACK54K_08115 [Gemmatimonadaceae bacterium]